MAGNEGSRSAPISAAIVKVASRCNLNCTYCYLYNHEDQSYRRQPKFMSPETFQACVTRLNDYCLQNKSQMAVVLHGGEPTLMGAERLARLCNTARETMGDRLHCIAMQTNATRISEEIVSVIHRFNIVLGISLDGDRGAHDSQRVFRNGRGSYDATIAGIDFLKAHGIEPRILCVVQPGEDGAAIYRHFRALGIRSIDFLLPDVSHDNCARWYGQHGETPVARYLIAAFDDWLAEDNPNVHVRLFHNLIRSVMGGTSSSDALGNPLMSYLIVESNGDIEALDALKVCDEGITATGLNVHVNSLSDLEHSSSLLRKAVFDGFQLSETCSRCSERPVCGGGYLPHRYSRASGFDNPSVWCSDIKKIIAHVRERVTACV